MTLAAILLATCLTCQGLVSPDMTSSGGVTIDHTSAQPQSSTVVLMDADLILEMFHNQDLKIKRLQERILNLELELIKKNLEHTKPGVTM